MLDLFLFTWTYHPADPDRPLRSQRGSIQPGGIL